MSYKVFYDNSEFGPFASKMEVSIFLSAMGEDQSALVVDMSNLDVYKVSNGSDYKGPDNAFFIDTPEGLYGPYCTREEAEMIAGKLREIAERDTADAIKIIADPK